MVGLLRECEEAITTQCSYLENMRRKVVGQILEYLQYFITWEIHKCLFMGRSFDYPQFDCYKRL